MDLGPIGVNGQAWYVASMQVVAISSPTYPEWRWRILDYSGGTLEESRERYPTISAAVAAGTYQLVRMSDADRSALFEPQWRTRAARHR